jgi:hypothetical protein
MILIKLILCALLFVLLMVGDSRAQSAQSPDGKTLEAEDLTSPVRSGSKTTYLDLLRQLFPDLQEDGAAHRTIALGSLMEPHNKQVITADIAFNFTPYWINSEGRRLLLLWVVLTDEDANQATPYQGGAVVLAVFRLEPSVKLLDAMRVEADRFTDPWGEPPILRLSARSDAFILCNSHWNAGESFYDVVVLFVDAGRFKVIASAFTYNFTACDATYSETPSFRVVADPGNKYPKLLVKVRLKKKAEKISCEPRGRSYTRTYQGFYRWNRAKGEYESHSRQLDRFDQFNKKWL